MRQLSAWQVRTWPTELLAPAASSVRAVLLFEPASPHAHSPCGGATNSNL